MKTIVVLVDFSDVTPRLLEQARELSTAFGAALILVHVVPEEPVVIELGLAAPTIMQPPSKERVESDYAKLVALGDGLAAAGANVSVQQLVKARSEDVIALCENLKTDLMIVGSHHHNTLFDLFIGTFTSDVLKRAKCPVLVVPATGGSV
jgi:nucleotide-binding universal stress UspA family protein